MGLEKKEYEQLSFLDEDVGAGLTLLEYARILHRDINERAFVIVAKKSGELWQESAHHISEWQNKIIINDFYDCYVSVNAFYKKANRRIENLRLITSLYSDLDIYNLGLSQEEALKMIDAAVKKGEIPEPTIISSSGRGMYAFWLIRSAPGKYKNVRMLYDRVQNFLYERLKNIGADPKAKGVAGVVRMTGTKNTKNKETAKVLRYNEGAYYTLKFMQDFMNDFNGVDWDKIVKEKDERRAKQNKAKTKRKSKIKRLFNVYTLAISRAEDIEMLCELRSYDVEGYRNTIIHIYAYQMMRIHKDLNVARFETNRLNNQFVSPFSKKHVSDVCSTAYRAYKDHEKDPKKGYNYKNSTLIKELEITEDEEKHMKTIISTSEKYRRNNARRRDVIRGRDGLTDKQREVKERREEVKRLYKKGLNQTEIATKLRVNKMTISRDIKALEP